MPSWQPQVAVAEPDRGIAERVLGWLVERQTPDPQYSVGDTVAIVCTKREPGEIVEQLNHDWPHAEWWWEETKVDSLPGRYQYTFLARDNHDA